MVNVSFSVPALKDISDVIREWADRKANQNTQEQARQTAALDSFMEAVRETRHYLAITRDNPAAKSSEKEQDLSRLWQAAGSAMRAIDKNDVASTLLMKADYWSDSAGWTGTKKERMMIDLDAVARIGREALLGQQDHAT